MLEPLQSLSGPPREPFCASERRCAALMLAVASPGAAELVFPAGQEGAAGQEEPSEAEGLPALAALHELVGLKEVKAHCQNLCDAVALEKERGDDPKQKSFSLVVTGNPGTGKTAFAQLYGQLLGGPAG